MLGVIFLMFLIDNCFNCRNYVFEELWINFYQWQHNFPASLLLLGKTILYCIVYTVKTVRKDPVTLNVLRYLFCNIKWGWHPVICCFYNSNQTHPPVVLPTVNTWNSGIVVIVVVIPVVFCISLVLQLSWFNPDLL